MTQTPSISAPGPQPDARGKNFFWVSWPDSNKSWWSLLWSSQGENNARMSEEILRTGTYSGDEVVPLKICSGRLWADFVSGCWYPVVSERLLDVLSRFDRGQGRRIPLAIYDRSDQRIVSNEYVWYVPPVGAGKVDHSRGMALLWQFKEPIIGRHPYGFVWDESTWNGADVFKFENTHHLIVSEHVADAIHDAKIDRLRITNIKEAGLDIYRERCRRAGLSQPPELESEAGS